MKQTNVTVYTTDDEKFEFFSVYEWGINKHEDGPGNLFVYNTRNQTFYFGLQEVEKYTVETHNVETFTP